VFVMDEPTSALSEPEAERLFSKIRELVSRGAAIVYITHRLEEIHRLADRVTVLRDGARVLTRAAAELSRHELLAAMVGRELARTSGHPSSASAETALRIEGLSIADPARPGRLLVDRVSFELRRGELLGLAGLQGSGASELLHAIFAGPADSIAHGTILLSNDRSTNLVQSMNVRENVTLSSLRRFSRFGWIARQREAGEAQAITRRLKLVAASLELPVAALSGGNQQKAALARCLLTRPRVLLLDEPTRGIDVGARADVYGLIRELGAQGLGVVLFSSELEELTALCDRILVMCRGRAERTFERAEFAREAILHAAMGGRSATA